MPFSAVPSLPYAMLVLCLTFDWASTLRAEGPIMPLSVKPWTRTTEPIAQGRAGLWKEVSAAQRWVFLGDSNTFSGGYVALLDAWLDAADLPHRPELLNLGVSSETASGLSEVDHPFKRPCVHERLRKVLAMTAPDVVFVCYGMNDGIYQPASEENLAAYQRGMLALADVVRASGARLVCMTPPIFEPEPLRAQGKLGPSASGRYAYFAPAEDYDQVLQIQAEWCLENVLQADCVIDLHTMLENEKAGKLDERPDFTFSKDGVHFGSEAHALVAECILQTLGAAQEVLAAYPSDDAIARAHRAMRLRRDAYLAATGKNRPGLPAGWPIWLVERELAADKRLSP